MIAQHTFAEFKDLKYVRLNHNICIETFVLFYKMQKQSFYYRPTFPLSVFNSIHFLSINSADPQENTYPRFDSCQVFF